MLPAVSRPVFQPGGNLTVSLQLFASLAVSSISALSFDKDLQLDLGLTRAIFRLYPLDVMASSVAAAQVAFQTKSEQQAFHFDWQASAASVCERC